MNFFFRKAICIVIVLLLFTALCSCGVENSTLSESTALSSSSLSGEASRALDYYNSQKDFKFISMTLEEADALFGEVLKTEETELDYLHVLDIRRDYKDVYCHFYKSLDNPSEPALLALIRISSPEYSPIRDIRVGDSVESVLAKFPDENHEIIDGEIAVKCLYDLPPVSSDGHFDMDDFGFGYISYKNNLPYRIVFCDEKNTENSRACWFFEVYFNDKKCVDYMEISLRN